jgi:steroid delta-isomerase-like uncharacterized protein
MSEENKAIARRAYEEGWNEGNVNVYDEVYAADFVYYDPANPDVHSREDYKQLVSTARPNYSGLRLTIEDMITEGDKVAARGVMGGIRQPDEVRGVPAASTPVNWTWLSIFRLREGKIVELWNNYDALGIQRQLGLIPPLGEG